MLSAVPSVAVTPVDVDPSRFITDGRIMKVPAAPDTAGTLRVAGAEKPPPGAGLAI